MTVHDDLARMHQAGKFEPYVHYVRFPRYRNLVAGTRINFDHPITALVGPNGVNKTSILRALYGVPEGMSTGTYWFSTATDAIAGDRATCIHGRKQDSKIVEVLKQRSSAEKTPDYWEPSRPIKAYGMEDMPEVPDGQQLVGRSKTRWNPIEKHVVYLEACDRISSFDRCLHYGGPSSERASRKELIRRRAPVLQKAITEDLQSYTFYSVQRITKNALLSSAKVSAISKILGRSYDEIRLVQHSFYLSEATTVVLKRSSLKYTEAFAGSGEFAVCQIVTTILDAPPKSLILLDEPETFLHPYAQAQLMIFLAEQAKINLHQVVVTTHAPAIIRNLPPAAIKVLTLSAGGEVGLAAQSADPDTAFYHIGEPLVNITKVYVEDELAKCVVLRSLGKDDATRSRFNVEPLPGGKSALWMFALQFALVGRSDVRIVFDGDARPTNWPPKKPTQVSDEELDAYIKSLTGQSLTFPVNGGTSGGDRTQLKQQQRNLLGWIRENVAFLPEPTPEDFIVKHTGAAISTDAKAHFVDLAKTKLDDPDVNSATILTIQREYLAKVPSEQPDLQRLRQFLLGQLGEVPT